MFAATKALVHKILTDPFTQGRWTLQGFGMLRLHITDRIRLNIWDSRYAADPIPSLIHNHPWNFESTVIVGRLSNVIYWESKAQQLDDRYEQHHVMTLKPGEKFEKLSSTDTTWLREKSPLVIHEGESYQMGFDEIHKSLYLDGTVSLNIRDRGTRPDEARVFWPMNEEWQTAVPREATHSEIAAICYRSLKAWF